MQQRDTGGIRGDNPVIRPMPCVCDAAHRALALLGDRGRTGGATMDEVIIIGVDAAAQPENVALARCTLGDRLVVDELVPSCRRRSPPEVVAGWLAGTTRSLIAIDAPLGWPSPLRRALVEHRAGDPLNATAHALFRRLTDRSIHERTGKAPLDVGADRIARAAHAALALLAQVRAITNAPIPLAWSNAPADGASAIEVYPAATLRALDIPTADYKKAGEGGRLARVAMVARLAAEHVVLAPDHETAMASADHPIDAVAAALAGADFARGLAVAPPSDANAIAREEGWIWLRARLPRENSQQSAGP